MAPSVRLSEAVPHPLLLPQRAGDGEGGRSAELEAWGGATRSDARFLWLPEGHFFLSSSREALRDAIVRDLGPWLG